MKINSVAIFGSGAIGSFILWGLSKKPEIDVCVVASGERKARLERDGMMINHKRYTPAVRTPEEARGADLLLVCLKYNSLRPALKEIKAAANEHTIVMCLMNGVDSEDVVSEVIDGRQVIYSVIKVNSERRNGEVNFNPESAIGVIYGEKDAERIAAFGTERTDAISELFEGTTIKHYATDVILSEIWSKFRVNVSLNLPQAMVNCGVGAYDDSEHVAFISRKLREELEAVAAAKGIDISLSDPKFSGASKTLPKARYSTLQDLDAKRHTEIDMFSGAIVRMGKELGIPTPYNEFTYHMIKALEEKNDGLFDYDNIESSRVFSGGKL
ncbi:MAG: 2-dehydropantoate 2-reductase [Eubacteriales bacterium]|nr:2-dehydropantoate 2-reductase [Eubacteriales bacterium]